MRATCDMLYLSEANGLHRAGAMPMSHVFEVTDEQYEAIAEAARERGQAPEDFFRSWVNAVRQYAEDDEIDPEQAWFWTPEWQAKEAAADADIAAGRVLRFESTEEMFYALDAYAADVDAGRTPPNANE